jgi:hypothetical protein
MAGPLTANPDPAKFDAGPVGNVFVTGALTGLAKWRAMPRGSTAPRKRTSAMPSFHQKTDGLLRFCRGRLYSLPSLGTPYLQATGDAHNFGPVPLAYGTIAPSEAGRSGRQAALVGGVEANFTFRSEYRTRSLVESDV